MTRMSAASPLAPRSMRWRTPKRCCSSTIARRRSRKATSSLEEGVGADEDAGLAGGERPELPGALAALVAAGQEGEADAGDIGERPQRLEVLARQDLGRGHQRRLAAGLDGGEHGEERHQGLAGADVALQQAVHPAGLGHVGGDLGDGAGLGGGRRVGERGEHPVAQPAVAGGGEALGAAHPGAGERERHLVGEQLVVGEALAGGRGRGEVGRAAGGVRQRQRRGPVRPFPAAPEARLDPLREGRGPARGRRGPRGSWSGGSGPRSAGRPARRRAGPRRGAGCGRGGPSGRCRRRSRPARRRCDAGRRAASGAASRRGRGRRRAGTRSGRRGRGRGRGGCGSRPAGAGRPGPRR